MIGSFARFFPSVDDRLAALEAKRAEALAVVEKVRATVPPGPCRTLCDDLAAILGDGD